MCVCIVGRMEFGFFSSPRLPPFVGRRQIRAVYRMDLRDVFEKRFRYYWYRFVKNKKKRRIETGPTRSEITRGLAKIYKTREYTCTTQLF